MGDGLPSVEETQAAEQRRGPESERGPSAADGLAGRRMQVGAIDAERLRSAVASRLFGVEAEPVKIGRFTVLKRLGAGGMGVVYSAYDDQLDRKLAIKLLKGEANEQRRARLMREAQALARVSHPNVIHVYEVDTFRGQIYLAMEFVRGRTLEEIDRKPEGQASLEEVLEWFRQAGEGLAGAHEAGLVHRDFKPENCLVGDDGRVRVLDFGLARASGYEVEDDTLDDEERKQILSASSADENVLPTRTAKLGSSSASMDEPLTRTGAIMGTPAYMAPEQHLGGTVDERSDQFSFCVSLWEKLYGERPFAGETLPALAMSVTRGELREAPTGRGVPKWIQRVLVRGLSVKPADRWPDMRTLLTNLSEERRSRKKLIAGVSLLATLAVASFAYSATRESVGPCEDSRAELAGVWDSATRKQVQQAFAATGGDTAAKAFDTTAARLDGYVSTWVELHQQTCVARKVDKVDSPELYGRKMMCLGQRLARVEQFVSDAREVDAEVVPKLLVALDDLPPLSACNDEDALSRVSGTMDEATRARVEAVDRQLARVESKVQLGRYQDALDLSETALQKARDTGNAGVEARALLLKGRAQSYLKDSAAAEATLREALRRADVARDDTTRVRAWLFLFRHVGYKMRRFDEAEVMAADVAAALQKLGDAPLLEAEYASTLGSIANRKRDFDTAIEQHARAIEIRIAELGERSVVVAESRTNLANAYYHQGDLQAADREARAALAIFEDLLGSSHPYLASISNTMGLIAVGRAKEANGGESKALFEEGEARFRQAIEMTEKTLGDDHPLVGVRWNNLGIFLLETDKAIEAVEAFGRSLEVGRKAYPDGHVRMGNGLLGRGQAKLALKQFESAREDVEAALAIYRDKKAPGAYLGECLFSLAQVLDGLEAGQPSVARAREARAAYAESGEKHAKQIAEIDAWLAERG